MKDVATAPIVHTKVTEAAITNSCNVAKSKKLELNAQEVGFLLRAYLRKPELIALAQHWKVNRRRLDNHSSEQVADNLGANADFRKDFLFHLEDKMGDIYLRMLHANV